jgi:nitroreductase
MDIFETLAARYSYRKEFQGQTIPEEDIRKIVTAGLQAPSGCNCQTTSFAIVTDSCLRAQIAEILPTKGTRTAPVILIILTEEIVTPTRQTFELEDYGAAVENILLAVTALGYATVWLDGKTKLEGRAEKIHHLLKAPEEKHVRAVLPIGKPIEKGTPREKKGWEERVVYNKFE